MADIRTLPNSERREARLVGVANFIEDLIGLQEACTRGEHAPDLFPYLAGAAHLAVSLASGAIDHEGDQRDGYLMAWAWWSAMCVEGAVLDAGHLIFEFINSKQNLTEE